MADSFRLILALIGIALNPHFDAIFGIVYALFLIAILTAVLLVFIFLFARDSPETRLLGPVAFLIAGIASLLLAAWVIIYIKCIYDAE